MTIEIAVGNLVRKAVRICDYAGEASCNHFDIRPVFFDFNKSERIIPCSKLHRRLRTLVREINGEVALPGTRRTKNVTLSFGYFNTIEGNLNCAPDAIGSRVAGFYFEC